MKKFTAAIAAIALLGGVAAQSATPIFAGGKGDAKCNAGRGNQSETVPESDCDPGKSFKNNGGD